MGRNVAGSDVQRKRYTGRVTRIGQQLRRRFGDGANDEANPAPPGEPAARTPDADGEPGTAPAASSRRPTPADSAVRGDERQDVLERLRRRIAALDKRWKQPTDETPVATRRVAAQEALPGRLVDTPQGRVRVIEETVRRDAGHGRYRVGDFADDPARLEPLHLLYRVRTPPDPERLVFLDTETTGLAGGAGTLPFLVGLAWLDGGDLKVEQLFMDHPRQEPALVARLRERLGRFDHAVTYNGRAFDIPLLQNRFVLHRTPWPNLETALDLLPGARRLHRRHLDDRSLGSIERNVLGFHREDDVPGSEIPGIYHRFLLTGRPAGLAEVIRHNAWDVVALAALLGLQARLLALPEVEHGLDPGVDLALGELRYARGDLAGAIRHLQRAVERSAAGEPRPDPEGVWAISLVWLARAQRRSGAPEASAASWHRLLERLPDDGRAHLGLAKFHEHRTRDFALAERHARAAAAAGFEAGEIGERRLARIREKRAAAPGTG